MRNSAINKKEILYTLLTLIPIGRVVSYSTLAKILRTHLRTVARYLAHNIQLIIIPCHRVVKKNKDISGYSMGGPRIKALLLRIEGVCVRNYKVCSHEYYYDNEILKLLGIS